MGFSVLAIQKNCINVP